ncbi:hypothetical protein EAE32_06430 [Kocuria tytonicola]|uniref:Uncharacterized protein n=1 Tax=Kocuria tytonicola TaxID=2055946 RepID=A0A3L9L882_9MICC|nr:hypothetical protein [Kocuria tytonicola]RLY94771.1 hypothetical protein EAE32_06430 [Kocuria tytonicola]
MSTTTDFTGWLPAEVAEMTRGLYSESQLKRLAGRGEIAHHRGSRGKVIFFRDDVRALLRHTAVRPAQAETTTPAPAELTAPVVSPFRTTSRSRAAHNEAAAS